VIIGVLGGGQLGRMLALAGMPLGLRFRFLDPVPRSPASDVGDLVVGRFDDPVALDRFADGLDFATCEFENVPSEAARRIDERVPFRPGVEALKVGQDRLLETEFFSAAGLDMHPKHPAHDTRSLDEAVASVGLPCVIKSRRGGYDGRGQRVARTHEEARAAFGALGGPGVIVEAFVPFGRELSLVAVRAADGSFAAYPLVENTHVEGILRTTVAPAPNVPASLEQAARDHVRKLMDNLDYVGVMAVEFFEYEGRFLANELAPRVHNSGHWTIEGSPTSQFENHCRAVVGYPLGPTHALAPSVMVNLISVLPDPRDVLRIPGAHLHLYGKEPRPGRKLGHITITGLDPADLMRSVERVCALPGARYPHRVQNACQGKPAM
jgi:5-(carboxyamino)imidazole ribonucleotide synthase